METTSNEEIIIHSLRLDSQQEQQKRIRRTTDRETIIIIQHLSQPVITKTGVHQQTITYGEE